MLVIGLTGNIGSGKSTVAQMLARLGAVVIDADKLGHEILKKDSPAYQEIVNTFGQGILKPDSEIDRPRLGEIVFKDSESIARLNRIVHPVMKEVARKKLEDLRHQGDGVVVLEAAILFEVDWRPLVDEVWVTVSPPEVVNKRLLSNKGLDPEKVNARRRQQMPQEDKARLGDVVIDTNCSLEELESRVKRLYQERTSR